MSESRPEIADAQLDQLPVFPLPDVQLFPGALLPLHVFEDRYRALLQHCLSRGRCLAVATLKPGYEADYDGRPPVYDIMGAGVLLAAEQLDDGRWNCVVQGTDRVALLHELPPDAAFRILRVARLRDDPVADDHPLYLRLQQLLVRLSDAAPKASKALNLLLGQSSGPGSLTNLIGAHAVSQPKLRRRLLEELDVATRLDLCCQHVGHLLLEATEGPPNPNTWH